MKKNFLAFCMMAGFSAHCAADDTASPSAVIAAAKPQEWRTISADNLVVMSLATGDVLIELNPLLAPEHVANFRKLVRQGFYDGLSVYRFVEGFVAQGGAGNQDKAVSGDVKSRLKAEFYLQSEKPLRLDYTLGADGYAPHTGFLNSFPVAQNQSGNETWQVHCPGVFAMARDNDVDSGGTEFYTVLGHAPRYLDRNISVLGYVRQGMAAFQTLDRKPIQGKAYNPIIRATMAADLPLTSRPALEVMRTDSDAFTALVAARKNRPEAWFVETPDYVDVCGVSVPVRVTDD